MYETDLLLVSRLNTDVTLACENIDNDDETDDPDMLVLG